MIYGLFIFVNNLLNRRKGRLPTAIALIVALIIISDCFTGLIPVSIMQHMMFLLVIFIAYQYLIICDFEIQLNEIKTVLFATLMGYGTIFVISGILFLMMPTVDGLLTVDRLSPGLFEQFLSEGGKYAIRFRGFCIDPNAVVATLVPGAVIAFTNLMAKYNKTQSVIGLILYSVIIGLSGSRMALVCSICCAAILLFSKYKLSLNKSIWLFYAILVIIWLCLCILFYDNSVLESIDSWANDKYQTRSGLTDENGRFTIWAHNLNLLFENNKFFFGVGQNQMYLISSLGKACHNTWLEWICGTGLFIGTFIILWFISAPYVFWRKIRTKYTRLWRDSQFLFFAYLTIVLCITSIDNITNSILIVSAVLFHYGTPVLTQSYYLSQETETDKV